VGDYSRKHARRLPGECLEPLIFTPKEVKRITSKSMRLGAGDGGKVRSFSLE